MTAKTPAQLDAEIKAELGGIAPKPLARKSKPRKRKRAFIRMGNVGIHSDRPDGYIICKPMSTAQASDAVYASETNAIKAARTLDSPRTFDDPYSTQRRHEVVPIRWSKR